MDGGVHAKLLKIGSTKDSKEALPKITNSLAPSLWVAEPMAIGWVALVASPHVRLYLEARRTSGDGKTKRVELSNIERFLESLRLPYVG